MPLYLSAQMVRTAIRLLAVAVGLFLLGALGITQDLDQRLRELRFLADERSPGRDIVLVDIDAKSLAEIGVWPWSRRLHAQVVDRASELGAKRIAFDVDFSSRSTADADEAFAVSLANSQAESFLAGIVQPESPGSTSATVSLPTDTLLQHSWPAMVNVPVDENGNVWRFPRAIDVGDERLSSMPTLLAGQEGPHEDIEIDYSINAEELQRISYIDLLKGRVSEDRIAGKTLIVGATALELRDFFSVPVHGIISGSTIIALATETLLQGRSLELTEVPLVALVGWSTLALVLMTRLRGRRAFASLMVLGFVAETTFMALQMSTTTVVLSASLHLTLVGVMLMLILSEFDFSRLRIWMARAEARNGQEILARVIDESFDGIIILNEVDEIVRTNDTARQILGLVHVRDLSDLPVRISEDVARARDSLHAAKVERPCLLDVGTPKGDHRTIEYTVAPIALRKIEESSETNAAEAIHVCVTVRDVTERQRAEDRLREMALHDHLTGLHNRRALEQRLDLLLAESPRAGGVALLSFDLDRFKAINDGLGHQVGDKVLFETARRAERVLKGAIIVARLGGDEFAALIRAETADIAASIASALSRDMARPFEVGGHQISISASIGVRWWNEDGDSATVLMRQADTALYKAKSSPARLPAIYDASLEDSRMARLDMEHALLTAFDNEEFELAYQPQLDLRSGALIGVEALLRWQRPHKGAVSPADFIPVAEEMGLIHSLGAWVLEKACRDAMAWPMPITVAVNVSPVQFEAGDLVEAVRIALTKSGLPAWRLELEMTESAFIQDGTRLVQIFEDIDRLGIKFALDDFGTGYSSLGYLHRFPISKIKIDRSFVSGIPRDRNSMAILQSIHALSEGLNLRTIAEGIETQQQLDTLSKIGINVGQGYFFSKPLRNKDFITFIEPYRCHVSEHLNRSVA